MTQLLVPFRSNRARRLAADRAVRAARKAGQADKDTPSAGPSAATKKRRAARKAALLAKLAASGSIKPPDPERWLPKHLRSGAKKKGKARKGYVGSGAQGTAEGSSKETAKLDAFARAQVFFFFFLH